MNKKKKIILFSLLSIILLLAVSLTILIFSLTDNNKTTKNTQVTEEKIELNISPLQKEKIIDYDTKTKIVTLKIKPITAEDNYTGTVIFIYEDGIVSKNDLYGENSNLHTTFQFTNEQITHIKELISKLDNQESITEQCKIGNIYTILNNSTNKEFSSCGVCSSDTYDIFMDIDKILRQVGG